jgi:hypothetical protein
VLPSDTIIGTIMRSANSVVAAPNAASLLFAIEIHHVDIAAMRFVNFDQYCERAKWQAKPRRR